MRKPVMTKLAAMGLAALLTGATLVNFGSPSSAGDVVSPSKAGSKTETLAALIYADGTFNLKKGVTQVQHSGAYYTVYFNRNVSKCFFSVTSATSPSYTFSVQPVEMRKTQVLVNVTYNGGPTSGPFYIVATCFD